MCLSKFMMYSWTEVESLSEILVDFPGVLEFSGGQFKNKNPAGNCAVLSAAYFTFNGRSFYHFFTKSSCTLSDLY